MFGAFFSTPSGAAVLRVDSCCYGATTWLCATSMTVYRGKGSSFALVAGSRVSFLSLKMSPDALLPRFERLVKPEESGVVAVPDPFGSRLLGVVGFIGWCVIRRTGTHGVIIRVNVVIDQSHTHFLGLFVGNLPSYQTS